MLENNEKPKMIESTDYNPYEHRDVEKPNSNIRSLANLLKASLGTGILAMPLAFASAGWGVGIIGTLVVASICAHCVHILVVTSRECCKVYKKPSLTYAETCEAAFANGPKRLREYSLHAKVFVEFALGFTHMGICSVFIVLAADNLKQLLDKYLFSLSLPVEYYCLALLVPLCIICQIRHLKWLAPFSLIANMLVLATFIICLYYIFDGELNIAERKVIGPPSRFPAFLSTVIFALEGIGVVMPIENAMKKPQHFTGCPSVLCVAMSITITMYTILGLFGYFRFGDVAKGSITLNLPIDDWPAVCAKGFVALTILLTLPLQYFVVIDILTRYIQPHIEERYHNVSQIFGRTAILCVCGGIAVALPMLEQIITLVGAFFYSFLGLMIPAVVETVFHWGNFGKWKWLLVKNVLIFVFGVVCLFSGCTLAVVDIVHILDEKNA